MWEQLVNTALLGTDKPAFDEPLLPEPLRIALNKFPHDDRESRFLKTAALAYFYKEAGKLPPRFTNDLTVEVIVEEKMLAPVQLSAVLNDILEVHTYYRDDLLERWFDKLIENRQIIQPKQVVTLAMAENSFPQKFRPKILKVIGKKGERILAYKTDISQWQILPDEQIWQEGRLAERRTFFTTLRHTDPQKAIELLETTWEQESLTDKKAFLEVIKSTFRPTDIPFLEKTYIEFDFKPKERKGQKECRAIAAALLLSDENTALFQQTEVGLLPYFQIEKSKGLLNRVLGKETTSIHLPEIENDFWNTSLMLSLYGLDPSPDVATFPTNSLYWFSCLIEILPFEFWMKHLEKDLEQCVAYFLSDAFKVKIEGKNKSVLRAALVANAQFYKNIPLTEALLKGGSFDEQLALLPVLSIADRENFLIQQKHLLNLTWLRACFGDWHGTWSATFSQQILQEAYNESILKNNYLSEQIGVMMARCLHPSSLIFLKKVPDYPIQTHSYYINHWQKWFVEAIQKYVDIRNRIEITTDSKETIL